jgi:hypothetical protein
MGIARVAANAHVRKGINILFFHTDIAQACRDIDVAIQLRRRRYRRLTRFINLWIAKRHVLNGMELSHSDYSLPLAKH